jgi:hypothetical protein
MIRHDRQLAGFPAIHTETLGSDERRYYQTLINVATHYDTVIQFTSLSDFVYDTRVAKFFYGICPDDVVMQYFSGRLSHLSVNESVYWYVSSGWRHVTQSQDYGLLPASTFSEYNCNTVHDDCVSSFVQRFASYITSLP